MGFRKPRYYNSPLGTDLSLFLMGNHKKRLVVTCRTKLHQKNLLLNLLPDFRAIPIKL